MARAREVWVFRHVPFEGAGLILPVLERRGICCRYFDLYSQAAQLPDTGGAAGLIFLGGPMSVNDDLPWLRQETDLIVAAIERKQPVLGICLGSQLIASALGARVYRNRAKEIGWYDIHLTEAGSGDPLFTGVGATETVFHWHGETFELPAGAARLAWSDACENQAVRFSEAVYGLQFHLEVTPAMIADWCVQDENCGDVREVANPIDEWYGHERLIVLANLVFGHWYDLLANPAPPE